MAGKHGMTPLEFKIRRHHYLRFAIIASFVLVVMVIGVCSVMIHWEAQHDDWPSGLWTATNIAALCVLAAAFVGGIWLDSKWITRHGFRCPACGRAFTLTSVSRSIRASGKCRCGEIIVEGGALP